MGKGQTAGEEHPETRRVPSGGSVLVLRGFYEGLELPIDRDRLVIGRGKAADLIFAEPTISRAHAVVGWDGEGFYAEDLGSTNGMLVNGARCQRWDLRNGDEIQMGRLHLRVKLPG